MTLFSRVAWKEGMFLVPQHFQQAERSAAAGRELLFEAGAPHARGVLSLKIDEAALGQGRLQLVSCRAVLSPGLTIDVPRVDPAPPARPFQLLPGTRSLEVFLSMPAAQPGAPLMTSSQDRADVPYATRVLDTPDDLDPNQREPIDVAVKNLRLVLGGESLEGQTALKIAELTRSADGQIGLRPDYAPPVLRLDSWPTLEHLVRELVATLSARARGLQDERRPRGSELADAADVRDFLFLQTVSAHAAVLEHLVALPACHPLAVYQELLRLAGSLRVFSPSLELSIRPYNHDALYECFASLDRTVRALLGREVAKRYEIVPLVRKEPFWLATLASPELRRAGEFVLAVTSDLPPAELSSRFPNGFIIAERERIRQAVTNAVGGVRVSLLARVPAGIPTRPDACYFRLHTDEQGWERIQATGQFAAYAPPFLASVRPELIALFSREGT